MVRTGCYSIKSTPQKGFTLIELLVVVAIIVILISILLPSLGRAKESAKMVSCQSNMRQIGIAMFTYSENFNGYLPPTWCHYQTDVIDGINTISVVWAQRLQLEEFLPGAREGRRSPTVCSNHMTPYTAMDDVAYSNYFLLSYGINRFMSIHDGASFSGVSAIDGLDDWEGTPQPRPYIKNSAGKILVAEITTGYIAWEEKPNYAFNLPTDWHQFDWQRHSSGADNEHGRLNILWLDGHVEPVRQGKDINGYLKNEVYTPHAYVGPEAAKRGIMQWRLSDD